MDANVSKDKLYKKTVWMRIHMMNTLEEQFLNNIGAQYNPVTKYNVHLLLKM